MSSAVDVVVIGAGAAGLAAGHALSVGGLTSVVLEADAPYRWSRPYRDHA